MKQICPSFGISTAKPQKVADAASGEASGGQQSQAQLVDVKVQMEYERENVKKAVLRAIELDEAETVELEPEDEGGEDFLPDYPEEQYSVDHSHDERILDVGASDSGSDSEESEE